MEIYLRTNGSTEYVPGQAGKLMCKFDIERKKKEIKKEKNE